MSKVIFKKEEYTNDSYNIIVDNDDVGVIRYKIINGIACLGFIGIYESERGHGYASLAIEHLLNSKKVDCIIGETVKDSRGFWTSQINKFGGHRFHITYCNNTTSSFVIPNVDIDKTCLIDLLEVAYNI